MKKSRFASVLVLLCVYSSAFAQETKTDRAIRAVKELCLTGTQFDLKADAKGNLTLRKLLPGGEGAVSVNVRESSGAAAIFDEKIRQIADEDIRRCIQPYIKPMHFLNLLVLFREDFLLLSHGGASLQSLWIMPSKNAENHCYVFICAHSSA